ncbi:MAG: hypothetical protein ACYC7D_15230 [Nitrososphaerales archaeon]
MITHFRDYYVTNEAVYHAQLSKIAKSTKEVQRVNELDVTVDKGYFNSLTLKECLDAGITLHLPDYRTGSKNGKGAPAREFQRTNLFTTRRAIVTRVLPANHFSSMATTSM